MFIPGSGRLPWESGRFSVIAACGQELHVNGGVEARTRAAERTEGCRSQSLARLGTSSLLGRSIGLTLPMAEAHGVAAGAQRSIGTGVLGGMLSVGSRATGAELRFVAHFWRSAARPRRGLGQIHLKGLGSQAGVPKSRGPGAYIKTQQPWIGVAIHTGDGAGCPLA
jgi:hypothetical protein